MVLQLGVYVPQVVFKQVAAGDMQEHAIVLAFKYLINMLKEKYCQNWLESFKTYQDSFFYRIYVSKNKFYLLNVGLYCIFF